MAEKKSAKTGKSPSMRKDRKATVGFTKEEREAMRERARETKSAGGESDVLAAIARMPEPDRGMATRLHAIIKASAPGLVPKTWYGMPAYADGEGKVVCFFRNASKFKDRYATFGFNDRAKLDDGNMWPTAFALTRLTAGEEKRIAALVKKAVG
ncbi:MAG: iron chaperone [Rhodanobacteraceae bacterium]